MRDRCYNEKHISYKYYGKRGITICAEWMKSFDCFKCWALSNGYSDELTLDRIESDGNYNPNNCKWSTRSEQQNNRRDNIRCEIKGKVYTPSELAVETGCSYMAAYLKISRILKKLN